VIANARRRWLPDPRLAVLEVERDSGVGGVTTIRDARDALRRAAADAGLPATIRLLPDDDAAARADTDRRGHGGPGAAARRTTGRRRARH